jgi:acyl-CoA dehydrogenase
MDHDSRTMLLETADRFFTERCGKDVVNSVEKGVWPADLWKEIEEMGLSLIAVPEDKGGVGGTLADMLALLRMAGSHAVPVPIAETALANLLIAAAGGTPKPGPATLVLGNLKLSGGRVSGKVDRVPFAGVANRFVTVVGNTLAVIAKANAKVAAKPSHAGEPYGTVTFDNAATEFSGASSVNAERALELAAVTRAMQMAGAADKVLATTVEYSKQRVQFGRPIGSFQAIQHKCANMLVEVESSKSITYYAAWAVANDVPEASLAAAMAKAYTSDAYRHTAGEGIQIHGGIGFTWEHDMHIFFKRAKSSEVTFGDATWNREIVARLIDL